MTLTRALGPERAAGTCAVGSIKATSDGAVVAGRPRLRRRRLPHLCLTAIRANLLTILHRLLARLGEREAKEQEQANATPSANEIFTEERSGGFQCLSQVRNVNLKLAARRLTSTEVS